MSNYHIEAEIKISYGRYIWCGNGSSDPGSGFFLNPTDVTDNYGDPCSFFITLIIQMNSPLFLKTQAIELYDHTGFLFGYTTAFIDKHHVIFYKKISPELIGTKLTMKFGSYEPIPPRTFSRPRFNVIAQQNITIPNLEIKSDTICKICLDEVDDPKNKYIGPCGHMLHMTCLWQYLEKNQLLLPINDRCMKYRQNGKWSCCGSRKYMPFHCVYCQELIIR